MTVPYKMGTGHNQAEPTLELILQSLQCDARIHEFDEYDDVLGDIPYTTARKMADAIERQTNRLRDLLADDYDNFLNEDYDQQGD